MNRFFLAFFLALENYMLPCFSKQLFGLDCPGCGLQRSVLFLLKGEFMAAFKMYPAIYPIVLFLIFLGLNQLIKVKYSVQIKLVSAFVIITSIVINYALKMAHHIH